MASPAQALRLYSIEQYEAARARAVNTAREGDLPGALKSLENLLKLEPGNAGALYDYITVLVWNQAYDRALEQLPRLQLAQTPEYVLRALINAGVHLKRPAVVDRLTRVYMDRHPSVPVDTPSLISGKSYLDVARLDAGPNWYLLSLSILRELHQRFPNNPEVVAELAVLLVKAGQPGEALGLFEQLDPTRVQEYVLSAYIGSAAQLQRVDLLQRLKGIYAQRFGNPEPKSAPEPEREPVPDPSSRPLTAPQPPQSTPSADPAPSSKHSSAEPAQEPPPEWLLRAREAVERQDWTRAETLLLPHYLQGFDDPGFLQLVIRLFDQRGEHVKVAALYQRLAEADPENQEAKRQVALHLYYAGAANLALERMRKGQGGHTSREVQRAQLDRLAFRLRWSQYSPPPNQGERAQLDAILAEMEALLAGRLPPDLADSLKADQILALRLRGHTARVIALYEGGDYLRGEWPRRALQAVADAYLAEHRPKTAIPLYEQLLQTTPDDFELQRALFHALSDAGEYRRAMALAEAADRRVPAWRKDHGGEVVKPNQERLAADILLANAHAYADDLTEASDRFEGLRDGAPYNAALRENLSQVYRWRGWPRQALSEARIGRTIDPTGLYTGVAEARALLEMKDYEVADQAIGQLNAAHPDHPGLTSLNQDWALHNRRELVVRFDSGRSQAEAGGEGQGEHGSADMTLESFLYDRPRAWYFRPYLHQYRYGADFTEGEGEYRRLGVGLEYRKRRTQLNLELGGDLNDGDATGASLRLDHWFNDYLNLSLGHDSFSTDIPVRAYFHGIDGNGSDLGLRLRLNELTDLRAGLGLREFSDGNRRESAYLGLTQRLVTTPTYKLNLQPSAYVSSNSQAGGPYFNPSEDRSLGVTLNNEWLTLREHDRRLTQRLELSLGTYDQHGYGEHPTRALVYSHEWDIDRTLGISYGIKYQQNSYDGNPEQRTALFGHLNWRF